MPSRWEDRERDQLGLASQEGGPQGYRFRARQWVTLWHQHHQDTSEELGWVLSSC